MLSESFLNFIRSIAYIEAIQILTIQYVTKELHIRKAVAANSFFILWCHSESNQGHMDFQSIALPTELWHLLFGLQI